MFENPKDFQIHSSEFETIFGNKLLGGSETTSPTSPSFQEIWDIEPKQFFRYFYGPNHGTHNFRYMRNLLNLCIVSTEKEEAQLITTWLARLNFGQILSVYYSPNFKNFTQKIESFQIEDWEQIINNSDLETTWIMLALMSKNINKLEKLIPFDIKFGVLDKIPGLRAYLKSFSTSVRENQDNVGN
ncbi:MAG: hypothetical protein IH840_12270 [Candidatus Heimdallarchaeota archaeon]|nr:hypothetical protein [Candidatus Heimdallarchaeota archaeon]